MIMQEAWNVVTKGYNQLMNETVDEEQVYNQWKLSW